MGHPSCEMGADSNQSVPSCPLSTSDLASQAGLFDVGYTDEGDPALHDLVEVHASISQFHSRL